MQRGENPMAGAYQGGAVVDSAGEVPGFGTASNNGMDLGAMVDCGDSI